MAALKKAGEAPPRKQFGKMVRAGVINREGQITTLYGGRADPDLSAVLETLKARTPTSVLACPPSGVGHASGNLAVALESSQRNLRTYSAYSRSGRRSMVISKAQYEKLLATLRIKYDVDVRLDSLDAMTEKSNE